MVRTYWILPEYRMLSCACELMSTKSDSQHTLLGQTTVGKGLLDEIQLHEIHDYMSSVLIENDKDARLDGIYVCTSIKEQNDPNMKPHPGMILQAYNDFRVAPQDCVFVGDTITDLQAATSANVASKILVSTGYGRSIMKRDAPVDQTLKIECSNDIPSIPKPVLPFYYTKNLSTAVSFLELGNSPVR